MFGQLTDITGNEMIALDNICDTDTLVQELNKLYPAMASHQYIIAVDKKAIQENTPLHENSMVALLPPFSGG
ncbi:MAG: MoaD/ThiS family protein [Chitinophagaceae bacterium]